MAYSFQAKVTARGYHVYKNTTWEDAKCGDKVLTDLEMDEKSIEIDGHSVNYRPSIVSLLQY